MEFSFEDAYDVKVPGDWNTQIAELFWYRGVAWYQKEFSYRKPAGKLVFLYFGGANFSKDAYLNGHLLARHRGGFTPFNVDVTDYIKDGDNALVVKVNSLSQEGDVPTERNDWMNYGGITREVLVVELPSTYVGNYHIQLEKGSPQKITGWVDVGGGQAGQKVTVSIPELAIERRSETDSNGRAAFAFDAKPQLWSPDSPKLYDVVVSAGKDSITDSIGFRTLETKGEDILLNGKPVFLRGISMHEESVRHPGRAYGPEDADAAIRLIKELNGNFVRLAHYPHSEHMVRAADREGVLVWAEVPVYHGISFDSPETLVKAKQQMGELINHDRNRAAVALWSIANEAQPSDARNSFLAALSNHVREEDSTRLVTAALLGFDGMELVGKYLGARLQGADAQAPTNVIHDPLGEELDVLGYNQYMGWYVPNFLYQPMDVSAEQMRELMLTELPKFSLDSAFGKPIIVSETGAGAKQGFHGPLCQLTGGAASPGILAPQSRRACARRWEPADYH